MSEYILTENLHLGITPAGTYYAVQDNAEEPSRLFLHRLLQESVTPLFTVDVACELSGYKKKRALLVYLEDELLLCARMVSMVCVWIMLLLVLVLKVLLRLLGFVSDIQPRLIWTLELVCQLSLAR